MNALTEAALGNSGACRELAELRASSAPRSYKSNVQKDWSRCSRRSTIPDACASPKSHLRWSGRLSPLVAVVEAADARSEVTVADGNDAAHTGRRTGGSFPSER